MTELDRRTLLQRTAFAAVATVPLAGCSSSGGTPSEGSDETPTQSGGGTSWKRTSTVEMTSGLKFVPKRIKVSKGTSVTWKNTGSIGHTVTAYEDKIPEDADYFASGGYKSEKAAREAYSNDQGGNIPKGESYSHTFETKGTYKYFCIPHEMNGMIGYVKVV